MRVVLAEDSGLLRDALTRLLADHEIEVAAAVTTVPELLEAYEREQPDVAVVDVRLPPTFTDEGIRGAVDSAALDRPPLCSSSRSTSRSGTRATC